MHERRKPKPDDDGIRTTRRTASLPLPALAGLVAVAGLAGWLLFRPGATSAPARPAASGSDAKARADQAGDLEDRLLAAAPPEVREVIVRRRSDHPWAPALVEGEAAARRRAERQELAAEREGDHDDTELEIDARDYIAALRAEGETEGIAAFPPPGTNPPKSGLLVPEDYELPEGFVRHYQTTDGGQSLDPILTVHPDYDLYDGNGNPLPLGPDRVVPPEYRPPDLPYEVLEVPDERAAGGAID